jgi:MFS family permease
MIWLPSYLSTRFGYTLTQSALWTAVTVLGMACGTWIFGQFADRIGRRPALFTFLAGTFIMVLGYSQLTDATALLGGGAIMGVFVNGMLGGYDAVSAASDHSSSGPCRGLFVHGGDRASGDDLSVRYRRRRISDPGKKRRTP